MADAKKSIFNKSRGYNYANSVPNTSSPDQEKERQRARNKEPLDFDGTFDTKYVSSKELARDINAVFENLFSDFYGSVIRVVPSQKGGNELDIELYFRPSANETTGDSIKAFVTVGSKYNGSTQMKTLIHQATKQGKREKDFVLTDAAAELLYDFIPEEAKKHIKWDTPESYDKYISMIQDTPQNENGVGMQTNGPIYMCIKADMIQVLKFVYGGKQGKSGIIYAAAPLTPVRGAYNMQNVAGCNWILSVTKMTWDQYHKIMNELGVNVNQSRLDVIVADRYK